MGMYKPDMMQGAPNPSRSSMHRLTNRDVTTASHPASSNGANGRGSVGAESQGTGHQQMERAPRKGVAHRAGVESIASTPSSHHRTDTNISNPYDLLSKEANAASIDRSFKKLISVEHIMSVKFARPAPRQTMPMCQCEHLKDWTEKDTDELIALANRYMHVGKSNTTTEMEGTSSRSDACKRQRRA